MATDIATMEISFCSATSPASQRGSAGDSDIGIRGGDTSGGGGDCVNDGNVRGDGACARDGSATSLLYLGPGRLTTAARPLDGAEIVSILLLCEGSPPAWPTRRRPPPAVAKRAVPPTFSTSRQAPTVSTVCAGFRVMGTRAAIGCGDPKMPRENAPEAGAPPARRRAFKRDSSLRPAADGAAPFSSAWR